MKHPSLLLAVLFLVPALPAQEPELSEDPVEVYGGGVRPSMLYTGERSEQDLARVQLRYEAAYDDNPLLSLTPTQHDLVQTVSGHALYSHQRGGASLNLEYEPYYQFYRYATGYNRLEQTATADLLWKAASQWSVRLRNDFRDQIGNAQPAPFLLDGGGIASPTGLNQSFYTPVTRERQEVARLDLVHAFQPHTLVDLFGAYDQRTFPEGRGTLFGTILRSGGGELAWRVREHTTVGMLGLWERINLQGAASRDTPSNLTLTSLLPTLGWRPHPGVEVNLFAGPQRVEPDTAAPAEWRWAAGGSLADHTERAAAVLAVEHSVTDGGGLMTYVVSTTGSAAWRRRLHDTWELRVEFGASRNDWYPMATGRTRVAAETGSIALARSMGRALDLQFAYERAHQSSSEPLLPAAQFDRNRISSGLVWTLERASSKP